MSWKNSTTELELVGEKDKVLRTESLPWDFNQRMDATILPTVMNRIMLANNGMGLASNQIGVPYRLFVMGSPSEKFWACYNPEIVERLGVVEKATEGCLSFPNLLLDIERNSVILVRYSNSDGEIVEEELTGKWARCFQHELDHIDGICFDQRVSKLALGIAQRKRTKALKRK
ncbi:Peptide deformylase [compost metagenome]